eukprot:15042570-Ditylum_brightwellii.AAC.1
MAYAICNGPSHLDGCEFTPLYHMQGTSQIQNFLRHYRKQSDTKTPPNSSDMGVAPFWHVRTYPMGHNLYATSYRSKMVTFPTFISGSNRITPTIILHWSISTPMQT